MAKSGPYPLPTAVQAYAEAVNLYRAGRLEEAEKATARLLKSLPRSHDVIALLGLIKPTTDWKSVYTTDFVKDLRITI